MPSPIPKMLFRKRERPIAAEDRRQHLDQIQSVVTRMAGASSTAKAWLLPVVTAAYGYALVERDFEIAILGIIAVLLFAFLDASYLRQERAFRALYQAAVNRKVSVYDMNSSRFYGKSNGDSNGLRATNCRWPEIIWSWSLAGFYLPIALLGIAVVLLTILKYVPA